MLRTKGLIRKSVVPDIQVKILELCLSDEENGLLMPSTKRHSNSIDFRADWALKEIISSKIENQKKGVPLVLRKKQLYDKSINHNKISDIYDRIYNIRILPITIRKHLLYKDCRAG